MVFSLGFRVNFLVMRVCGVYGYGTTYLYVCAAKEPYICAKEPYICVKEPYICAKQPCICAKEACVCGKAPCGVDDVRLF